MLTTRKVGLADYPFAGEGFPVNQEVGTHLPVVLERRDNAFALPELDLSILE